MRGGGSAPLLCGAWHRSAPAQPQTGALNPLNGSTWAWDGACRHGALPCSTSPFPIPSERTLQSEVQSGGRCLLVPCYRCCLVRRELGGYSWGFPTWAAQLRSRILGNSGSSSGVGVWVQHPPCFLPPAPLRCVVMLLSWVFRTRRELRSQIRGEQI